MYIWKEIANAQAQAESHVLQSKLNQCTVEAVRLVAERDLLNYSDEELVRAIAAGLKAIPPGND